MNHRNQNYKNIILITVDSLRADHLSCYGYERDTTPNICSLAERGILLTEARANIPEPFISLPILFTSSYPIDDGKLRFDFYKNKTSIMNVLKDRGYKTIAVIVGSKAHLEEDFDIYIEKRADAEGVTEEAINTIKRFKNDELFIWIHYSDTHFPYSPPEPYDNIYTSNYTGPINGSWYWIDKINYEQPDLNEEEINHIISLYDGEVSYLDKSLGNLFNFLKNSKLDENSLIVLTSTQGEAFYEHDNRFIGHGTTLYDEQIKIPLIFSSNELSRISKKIEYPISHIDIAPTVLGILELDKPESFQGEDMSNIIFRKRKDFSHIIYSFFVDPRYWHDYFKTIYSLKDKTWIQMFSMRCPFYVESLLECIKDTYPDYNILFSNESIVIVQKKIFNVTERTKGIKCGENVFLVRTITREDVEDYQPMLKSMKCDVENDGFDIDLEFPDWNETKDFPKMFAIIDKNYKLIVKGWENESYELFNIKSDPKESWNLLKNDNEYYKISEQLKTNLQKWINSLSRDFSRIDIAKKSYEDFV